MSLLRTTFPVGALGCNCSLLACPETREALIIDPGDDAEAILKVVKEQNLRPVAILHTHAHFDHIMASEAVGRATAAEIGLGKEDLWLWQNVGMQTQLFGMPAHSFSGLPQRLLAGGETIAFGRHEARIVHTPGHTPGSLCVHVQSEASSLLFSGDTLFAGSVGRTDLWGGSREQLTASIQGPLFELPDHTLVVPGHGGNTSIGLEKEDNPFVGKYAR